MTTLTFDIAEAEAPVPVVHRGKPPAKIDPAVSKLYTDTLKPRGVPSSKAVVLTVPTRDEAETLIGELRTLARKDTPRVSVSSRVKPVNPVLEAHEQRVTVWLTEYTPRPRKLKDDTTTEPATETATESTPEANTQGVDNGGDNATVPAFVEPAQDQQDQSTEHGKPGKRSLFR